MARDHLSGPLQAPFPYFGGKSRAAKTVWQAFGEVKNYVEPFAGSVAMLLCAPEGRRIETINDLDGFVANFWRAVAADPDGVAHHADWPCSEIDLEARHAWLVQRTDRLRWQLEDPDFYDAKIAGWWVWGICNWIGDSWCSGKGPHYFNGANMYDVRQLPHLSGSGRGINRQRPHLSSAGQGINRKIPHLSSAGQGEYPRTVFIREWMRRLQERMRDVRVICGDWKRAVTAAVTTLHGASGVFLDPPYTSADMDYPCGGVGGPLATEVREWCADNGGNKDLRIVLCGHSGEHDALLAHGWSCRPLKATPGYARAAAAKARAKSEMLWFSPHCIHEDHCAGDAD